jgi:hypothetical protein
MSTLTSRQISYVSKLTGLIWCRRVGGASGPNSEGQVTHQPPMKGQALVGIPIVPVAGDDPAARERGDAPTAAAGPGIEGQAISQISPRPLRLRLPLAPLAPDSGSAAAPLPLL